MKSNLSRSPPFTGSTVIVSPSVTATTRASQAKAWLDVIDKIDAAIAKTVVDPEFIDICKKMMLPIAYLNNRDFTADTIDQIEKCKIIVAATLK